ncbi:FAD/NAD(P)-binding domain-containing protein [Agrocybe pediades]|nr:FAD/NAD(P)-binding domain-containing protein [Agrocybe pediades]
MVNIQRLLFSFLSSNLPTQVPLHPEHASVPAKSVAIVGAGSAGLAMLKTLLDLEQFTHGGWKAVLFDERESVGGIWLPDQNDVSPPAIPQTPLYPRLRTNTPVPSMTYPEFPFPPGTPLYPSHEHIETYHLRYAKRYNLLDSVRFKHRIHKATWQGSPDEGQWDITVSGEDGQLQIERFDHLVVATGNNHIPHIPVWQGQDEWLEKVPVNRTRTIIHSVYYRKPEAFSNQTVLVVGNGPSGRDAAQQILGIAEKVYYSFRHAGEEVAGVIVKPEISHFTEEGLIFVDGTKLDPDVVILGTGYEMLKPFLTEGGVLDVDLLARDNSTIYRGLVTNARYIFPLYRHILSLDPKYPTNALAFIGLPSAIANCPSDYAQSLFAAHAIVNPSILPQRHVLLQELALQEERVRAAGLHPYLNGHKMLNGTSSDYQDELIEFLKEKNAIPDEGKWYVEQWRRDIFTYQYMKRGWARIEKLGIGADWTRGVETEAEWADVMRRVNEWQKRWETENDIEFKVDYELAG